ncbi:MAG: 1-phosphofructokinase family hexose kinase [Agriterribacter sp.]
MSAIVTITFSPCIDKSVSVPALVPERKLYCSNVQLDPGGGGINVARAVKTLGGDVTAIFPAGGGRGKSFNALLKKQNVSTVSIDTVAETRENIIIFEEATTKQYRLGMPSAALNEREWRQCLQALEAIPGVQFVVVSGSVPPGVPPTVFTELANIVHKQKAKLVIDTSGVALKQALAAGVYLIKPNLAELCALTGRTTIPMGATETAAKELLLKYRCEIIVVSLGKEGAMMVTAQQTYTVKSPAVVVKSTVGAGDSMLAGLVHSLLAGKPLRDVLLYGVACGTAATLNAGTELCHKKDVDALLSIMAGTDDRQIT